MKWLVQEMLNAPENILRVLDALKKTETKHLLLRLNLDESFTVLDTETKVPLEDSENVLNAFIQDSSVMVYGSKAFAQIAKKIKLRPGSFLTEQFEFQLLKKALGKELLNHDFVVGELRDLTPIDDVFFIRPTENNKLFTGMTVAKEEFIEWQQRENHGKSPYNGQILMISPLQTIHSEYRFFVVEGKIVTSSSYVIAGKRVTTKQTSSEMVSYAKGIIATFEPAKAYVLDIAQTTQGFKVIEYNNINSSGLYDCEEVEFVKAINNLKIEPAF